VNDGSRDRSLQLLRHHIKRPANFAISALLTFGHQIAVTAGLNFCPGSESSFSALTYKTHQNLYLTLKWRAGFKSCLRPARNALEGWFKRFTAYGFYRLLKRLALQM